MKKLLLLLISLLTLAAHAQKNAPKWIDKQRKAIIEVNVYDKSGNLLRSGTAVYVSDNGDAIASYTLFRGAATATVKESDGKSYPVARLIGADEMYDLMKFRVQVPKRSPFVALAANPPVEGDAAYRVAFSQGKNALFAAGSVTEVSPMKEHYGYYKIDIPLDAAQSDAPLFTEQGELFGLTQEDATGETEFIYAISAAYANTLLLSAMDFMSATYTSIDIPKVWPEEESQAQVALMLLNGSEDAKRHLQTLNDFVESFPNLPDCYQSRASHYAYYRNVLASSPADRANCLKEALNDIDRAMQIADKKGDVYFFKSKLIYDTVLNDSTLTDENWSVESAKAAIQQALDSEDNPLYHQHLADIEFGMNNFAEAFDQYMQVNKSSFATSATYYMAAKAKENTPGVNLFEVLTLLDSAVVKSTGAATSERAAYLLERVEYKNRLMLYDEAIADYDQYYDLMDGRVNDMFYYLREQAKFRKGDMDAALSDIREAIRLNPSNAVYLAEEAAVLMRQEKYTDALTSLKRAIELAPEFEAGYRLAGLCHVRQGNKAEGCEMFRKAKELGDPVVDRLIKEHCE